MYNGDKSIETRIEMTVGQLLDFMEDKDAYDEDYKSMFNQLTKVMELNQQESANKAAHAVKLEELNQQLEQRNTITKEAWLTVGTHLAGLIVLMNHERAHVIASKAFGLVKKIF